MTHDVTCCHMMPPYDIYCWMLQVSNLVNVIKRHPMSSNVIQCHSMSSNVIQCHPMSSIVIQCHQVSSYAYPYKQVATLNFFGTDNFKIVDRPTDRQTTIAICRGVFTPKNERSFFLVLAHFSHSKILNVRNIM